MVSRLCVMVMNWVLWASVPNILPNRIEFASSRAASTSSSTTKGEGKVAKSAESRAIEVSARSPPESAAIPANFFPGGVARISIPTTSAFPDSALDSNSSSSSSPSFPPAERAGNSSPLCLPTVGRGGGGGGKAGSGPLPQQSHGRPTAIEKHAEVFPELLGNFLKRLAELFFDDLVELGNNFIQIRHPFLQIRRLVGQILITLFGLPILGDNHIVYPADHGQLFF